MSAAQDIFQLKRIFTNIPIKLCCRIESGVKQLLALITNDGDVVLHYIYGELPPVIKRIPWFSESSKTIQAISFDPTATWLLIVSLDSSLYIIPALSLVDKKQKIDCKWTLNDLTQFQKHPQTPESKPTSLVWWQTLDSNQNALVGYENGAIALISLTDGRCLGCCAIPEYVKQLFLCQDNTLETVSLLINGESGQQWRLMLEQHSVGCLWPPECANQADDSAKSKLHSLKQLGADKLAFIKQKLTEGKIRRDSDSSHSESIHSGPELLPCLCDTLFAPQFARNRYLFSAFYKPANLLTIHAVDVESAPLYVHKLINNTNYLLYTDRLIYVVNDEGDAISILSSQLSECRIEGDSEFNPDSLVARFVIENERILQIFRLTDLSAVRARKNRDDSKKDKHFELPKSVDDLNIKKTRLDTVVIVTDNSVYKIVVGCSPINKFVHFVTEENNLEKAERISIIFGLNLQQLLESCGDLMISRGSFHSGIILYKRAKVHILKRVLKLAISADCRTLLKFIHLCLSSSKVDMSMATKIHIGNLAVMAYTELILKYSGHDRNSNIKDFMNFLRFEEYYDQILAVNVACQAGHWNIVTLLAKSRGLQFEVVSALGQILQSARSPRIDDYDFLLTLSEPCLTQSLIILPQSSLEIFRYIRSNVSNFPIQILKRLILQLDPSQPCVFPLTSRLFQQKLSSSLDTTIDSIDLENPDQVVETIKDLIETFIHVLVTFISKSDNLEFNLKFMDRIKDADPPIQQPRLAKMPDLSPLSCGFEHASIVRNGLLYTMGVSSSGCLGLGPLLTQSSPPKLVQTLSDLKIKVLSVSCGRKHTLVLTEFGIYAFGSNFYGQLGLGSFIQESPYPQMVSALCDEKVVQVSAGQYHSLALTGSGRVYTWGWGIHGQLGHNSSGNEYLPKLLQFNLEVTQIAAGHAHSLLLTKDGKIFGFGSNVFGQLESSQIETNKATKPAWIVLMPDIYVPIQKIATSYFHNIAIRGDQEVYSWGASPQEVRLLQSKNNSQKLSSGSNGKNLDCWKSCVRVYSSQDKKPIDQVSIGYRHSAILHNGKILWGKNKDDELSPPKLKDEDNYGFFSQKFIWVSCGLDYTMAIDHTGKLLAWGSPTMAQTILGRSLEEENRKNEGKVVIFKHTRRVIKFPSNLQPGSSDFFPIEVPGLPKMAITYNPIDHRLIYSKTYTPYSVLLIENPNFVELIKIDSTKNSKNALEKIREIPNIQVGPKTLHFVLQSYFGLYDSESILMKCLDLNNYQAASKIAMFDGHFVDSLGFQLFAFKKYMDLFDLNLNKIYQDKEICSINEKQKDYVELVVKNMQEDFNEKNLNLNNSPAHILSSSSSLDSIRQWGDDIEHQGGCESPCEMSDGDVKQNITQYVQSLKNNDLSPPITSVSRIVSQKDSPLKKIQSNDDYCLDNLDYISDKTARDVIQSASKLVEFYLKKIYISENHILMQNILLKCIEFWLNNNLPVAALENVLLRNMDKYFYPLSILLFCKNFNNEELDGKEIKQKQNSAGFLKEFSTKFCLQLCSMVLENVNKT